MDTPEIQNQGRGDPHCGNLGSDDFRRIGRPVLDDVHKDLHRGVDVKSGHELGTYKPETP
ncbi:hypothetical protein ES703_53574 [subsurface metagenome]